MTGFTKIVRLGTTLIGKRRAGVYCKIEYNDGKLSITGVEGPLPSGNARGACGQIDMGMDEAYITGLNLATGWTRSALKDFLEIWRLYHLNDLQAACEHQRALDWTWATHPLAVCPVCDYKLGTKRLRMEVPEHALDFLVGLPNADKTPAWA